jgi:hypothetical protein
MEGFTHFLQVSAYFLIYMAYNVVRCCLLWKVGGTSHLMICRAVMQWVIIFVGSSI